MSILDETRSYLSAQRGKLQEERTKLIAERDKLSAQISEIDTLLHQLEAMDGKPHETPTRTRRATGTRRIGFREQVLEAVKKKHSTPAAIRTALNISDEHGTQAVSNALSALKKQGKIARDARGAYSVVG